MNQTATELECLAIELGANSLANNNLSTVMGFPEDETEGPIESAFRACTELPSDLLAADSACSNALSNLVQGTNLEQGAFTQEASEENKLAVGQAVQAAMREAGEHRIKEIQARLVGFIDRQNKNVLKIQNQLKRLCREVKLLDIKKGVKMANEETTIGEIILR